MGMMKHKMEENDMLYGLASNILERVGVIKSCEIHEDRYIVDESKLVDAYKLGNSEITKGNIDCDRKKLMDAIKDAYESFPEECFGCAKAMSDDD